MRCPRKFRHRWLLNVLLFLITLLFTTVVGTLIISRSSPSSDDGRCRDGRVTGHGLWYSLTCWGSWALTSWTYYFCRRYNIDASLPYFIRPAAAADRHTWRRDQDPRCLSEPYDPVDIGVGGPIRGVHRPGPALFFGWQCRKVVPMPTGRSVFYWGTATVPMVCSVKLRDAVRPGHRQHPSDGVRGVVWHAGDSAELLRLVSSMAAT